VYNLFTDTVLQGTHYDCQTWVLILHDFVAGRPTREITMELELDYGTVLKWRHTLQDTVLHKRISRVLPDDHEEADETYLNTGQPGEAKDDDDDDPPREMVGDPGACCTGGAVAVLAGWAAAPEPGAQCRPCSSCSVRSSTAASKLA